VLHNSVTTSTGNCSQVPLPPECNPPVNPVTGLLISKTSVPGTGSSVNAGTTVTYILTATNTDDITYDGVSLSDNLTNVLNHATLVAAPVTMINGLPATTNPATVSTSNVLSWNGSLAAHQTVTVTYQVTVNANVLSGQVLRNAVTGHAPDPTNPGKDVDSTCVTGTEPGCSSTLTVGGFHTVKTVSPSDVIHRGEQVTYTIRSQNLSDAAGNPNIHDDLSSVLDKTTYVTNSATATIDGVAQVPPVVVGTDLTWNGTVPAGKTVVITYTVTVRDTVQPGDTILNRVTAVGNCDPSITPIPEECQPTSPVVAGLQINKVSTPANGRQIAGGQNLTYTVTTTNWDNKALTVNLSDDLTGVLAHSDFNTGSLRATIDGQPAGTAPAWNSATNTVTWSGSLQAKQTIVITYSVLSDLGVTTDDIMRNGVIGSAPDPDNPGSNVLSTCVTGNEEGCYSQVTGNVPPQNPISKLDLTKTSTPSGTVHAGDTIAYRITGTNSGDQVLFPTITDNLSQVLNNAALDRTSLSATIDGVVQTPAPAVSDANVLTWSGPVAVGKTVIITYQVTVNATAPSGTVLHNAVTSDVPGSCDPTTDPACRHDVTVDNPGLQVTKTSNPASGSKVYSGEMVTYTLRATNTGADPLNVVLTDNLSQVLAHASMGVGPFTGIINNQSVGTLTGPNSSGVLTWTGVVPSNQTVVVTYSVRMNNDLTTATGALRNGVTGVGTTTPGGEEVPSTCETSDQPDCSSILDPQDIAFLVTKVSDPVSGTAVSPAQTITYTISGTNTSSGPINAVLTDDLTNVLPNANYDFGSVTATIDGAAVGVLNQSPTTMSWSGSVPAGKTVIMTYSVQVKQNATVRQNITNGVVGTATNPTNPNEQLPTSCPTGKEPGCSSTVVVGAASVQVAKASVPANGMRVNSGDTVAYTLTAQNNGTLDLDPVVLSDNLADVLDNADLIPSSVIATMDGQTLAAPTYSDTTKTLTWSGPVPVGKTVTVSYSVTVKADQPIPSALFNKLVGTGTDAHNPNNPATTSCPTGIEPGCFSNLSVGPGVLPRLDVTKTSTPASGSVVRAGQVITYTLRGANTGNVALNPVTLTDNLAGVARYATLVPDSAQARIDGQLVDPPSFTGSVLTWRGPVEVGKSVVVTYQYVVNRNITKDDTLVNSVTSTAVYPQSPDTEVPSTCETGQADQPDCSSILTGGQGNLSFTKVSDPVSGSVVAPGQAITYTLTATNTGNAPVDNVTVSDNLSGVLNNATLVPESLTAESSVVGAVVAAPTPLGKTVVWLGSLSAGQTVTVTYKVIVNNEVTVNDKIVNKVIGQGTNPEYPNDQVPSTCVTGDESGCYSEITLEVAKLDIKKTSNVKSATAGQTITYTITGVNSGNVDLNPVTLRDNLTEVLKYATLVPGSVKATVDGVPSSVPPMSNSVLTWSGPVPAGKTAILTYQVTVNSNVTTTATVVNHVTGEGVNPKNPEGPNPSSCKTGEEAGCSVPIVVGPTKIATGGAATHDGSPMDALPLMGVIAGLLLAYFTTRREVTIKH